MSSGLKQRAEAYPLRAARGRPAVQYGHVLAAEPAFWSEVHRLLDTNVQRVCDIGGGARPILSPANVRKRGLEYVVFDESAEQLQRAGDQHITFRGDALDAAATARFTSEHGACDLVMSRWTAEHMRSGEQFHRNVFAMLRPGGAALHLFPTLYALPFLVNRTLTAERSAALLARVLPSRSGSFPAFYWWCEGPSARQLQRLEGLGYEIERYVGFFGHSYYARVPLLRGLHRGLTRMLVRHPIPLLTSFALVVMRRPHG